ncbi:MAG: RsmE family RNA methyltransferase [Candidatus Paceibacterota bacterium]|jgi:16S rRNA (uracil1498-N3)-methyltransferase
MAKIHRFIEDFDLTKKELEISGDIAHQIIKVLKLEIGEKVELCNGKDTVALGEIKDIAKKNVIVKIISKKKEDSNSKKVSLFCAVLKKENFELVVQKATEIGISKIIPIISARTIKTGLNLERLQKIAKEASEQSGRISVPEILEPISFEKSLELCKKDDFNILFDGSGEPLGGLATKWEKINIFIGPEGGWTEEEIEKVKNKNFKIMNLGNLTLRGETAAIISSYLAVNLK